MDGLTLLGRARSAGLAVEAQGSRLVVRGPRSLEPIARELLERKDEILAALAQHTGLSPAWDDLSRQRWGPSVGDPTPGIEIPADHWRRTVARWPHVRWSSWRSRVGELLEPGASGNEIKAAERRAFEELDR